MDQLSCYSSERFVKDLCDAWVIPTQESALVQPEPRCTYQNASHSAILGGLFQNGKVRRIGARLRSIARYIGDSPVAHVLVKAVVQPSRVCTRTVKRTGLMTRELPTNIAIGETQRSVRETFLGCFTKRYDNDDVRQFWQTKAEPREHAWPTPGHSHGEAAGKRTSTARMIDSMGHQLGRQIYVVSSCRREVSTDPTYHRWYSDKDVVFRSRNEPVPPSAIIKMVDVDYYVDWKNWFHHTRPVAMYTFVPTDVRETNAEYTYSVTPDGVRMHVNGGSTYTHKLWDYSNDYVAIKGPWGKTVVCSVDVKMIDKHHRAILLNPVYSIRFFGSWIPLKYLKRMDFRYGHDAVAHQYRTAKGDVVSIGLLAGDCATTSVTLPVDNLVALKIRLNQSKHPGIGDVEKHLRSEDPLAFVHAPPLFHVLRNGVHHLPSRDATDQGGIFEPLYYKAVVDDGIINEDGKRPGRQVCPSLVTNPNLMPERCVNNDIATIAERVAKVANHRNPPIRYEAYAKEFVNLVVPVEGVGLPVSYSEVIEHWNLPAQRGRAVKVQHWMTPSDTLNVQAFMKGESYSKPGPPRNISSVPTEHNLELSSYTLAFKKEFKKCEWYTPGRSPKWIADRLVELACSHPFLVESDYSALDGSKSRWLKNNIDHAVYLRWAAAEHKRPLMRLLQSENTAHAKTSNGIAYAPGCGQLSGSATTTDGNTASCGFVSYAALREQGLSPKDAWREMGCHAGDDGVSTCDESRLRAAAAALGLVVKTFKRKGALSFLGRVFYDLDVGQNGSLQDCERTWSKLHLSFAPPGISDHDALANKARGYLALDPDAPVTSDWCRAVTRIIGKEGELTTHDAPYHALQMRELGGWPQLPNDVAYAAIAWRTGRWEHEIRDLVAKIRCATTLDQLAGLWSNPDHALPITVEVNGTILQGEKTISCRDAITKTPPVTKAVRFNPNLVDLSPHADSAASGNGDQTQGRPRGHLPRSRIKSFLPSQKKPTRDHVRNRGFRERKLQRTE